MCTIFITHVIGTMLLTGYFHFPIRMCHFYAMSYFVYLFFQILSDEDSNQMRSFAASYHIGFD